MNVFGTILTSFLGSAILALLFVYLYYRSAKRVQSDRAYAECWWLPAWKCYRFVIRNMHSAGDLHSIRFHSWLRITKPAKPGSSVNSFLDLELTKGERIHLASGQDLPVLCFRLNKTHEKLVLVHTDKFGKQLGAIKLTDETEDLRIQYQLKVENLRITHEVIRVFVIPYEIETDGKDVNLFEYLLSKQGKSEFKFDLIFETATLVSIPAPT